MSTASHRTGLPSAGAPSRLPLTVAVTTSRTTTRSFSAMMSPLGRVQVRHRPDERPQQAGQVLRAGDVAEAPAVPDDVAGHELSRLVRVVLVEHLVDVVARELLVGLELVGGGGHCPLL